MVWLGAGDAPGKYQAWRVSLSETPFIFTPQNEPMSLVQCLKHAEENTALPGWLGVGRSRATERTAAWKLLAYSSCEPVYGGAASSLYGSWYLSNWEADSRYRVVRYGSRYWPNRHFHWSAASGYAATHSVPSRAVAFTKPYTACVSFCAASARA